MDRGWLAGDRRGGRGGLGSRGTGSLRGHKQVRKAGRISGSPAPHRWPASGGVMAPLWASSPSSAKSLVAVDRGPASARRSLPRHPLPWLPWSLRFVSWLSWSASSTGRTSHQANKGRGHLQGRSTTSGDTSRVCSDRNLCQWPFYLPSQLNFALRIVIFAAGTAFTGLWDVQYWTAPW